MFGYVNVKKDLLLVRDYNIFRGYYCGLCKQLGRSFNTVTRMGLSYDMTFLAILISSLFEEDTKIRLENCIAHPFSKRPVKDCDFGIEYASEMSVILTYLKLRDDRIDEHSLKSFASVFYFLPYKKAISKHREKYEIIEKNLKRLNSLERQKCKNVDEVSDCFGKILECVFDFNSNNRVLSCLGYQIGRFIYITDAYDDISRDKEKGCYNPFLLCYGSDKESLKKDFENAMTYTLSEISKAYSLLDIKKNKEICDNVIYLGLRDIVEDRSKVNL